MQSRPIASAETVAELARDAQGLTFHLGRRHFVALRFGDQRQRAQVAPRDVLEAALARFGQPRLGECRRVVELPAAAQCDREGDLPLQPQHVVAGRAGPAHGVARVAFRLGPLGVDAREVRAAHGHLGTPAVVGRRSRERVERRQVAALLGAPALQVVGLLAREQHAPAQRLVLRRRVVACR
jgi:hypothetical protein